MQIKMFNFDGADDKHYNVSKSSHVYDKRFTSVFHRDGFISDTSYKKLMRLAILGGLTSFRHKGPVVLSFEDYRGRNFSILMILDRFDLVNDIFIITVFKGSKEFPFYKHFTKEHNRLWISPDKFVLPYMDTKTRTKQKMERERHLVDIGCWDEDVKFIDTMNRAKVKRSNGGY